MSPSEDLTPFQKNVLNKMKDFIPILILGNKTDKEGAVSRLTLLLYLNILPLMVNSRVRDPSDILPLGKLEGRRIQLRMCSARNGTGFRGGMEWLVADY